FQQIANLEVGFRIDHDRAADLSVFLTSPQGTRVLLAENRGRTNTLGYGEGGPNTETFKERYRESFESYRRGDYTNSEAFGPWQVLADMGTVRFTPGEALTGFRLLSLTAGGVVSNSLETVSNRVYELTYGHRAPEAPGAVPVSWYRLDGNALDSAGANNGTLFGSPAFVAGKVNQAMNADGVNDHVRIPASSSLDVGTGAGLTIDAWINPSDVSIERPIAEWNNGTGAGPNQGVGVHFWLSDSVGGLAPGTLYANLVDAAGNPHFLSSTLGAVVVGAAQHVALTYDAGSGVAALYLDGAQLLATNVGAFVASTTQDLYLGYRPAGGSFAGRRFVGALDEVGLYDRALSGCEIQA
ncbi:MAG TPA: hypothetical protein DCY13_06895, partial [Verrucomicrobiales bacterium]|nr:hypothetical protein [Verrucomicrobiales bacterium]